MEHKSVNVTDEARSDVRGRGFWSNRRNAFFDFRVFYPFASSHYGRSLAAIYKSNSLEKKRHYQERVAPLVKMTGHIVDIMSTLDILRTYWGHTEDILRTYLNHWSKKTY